MSANRCAQEPEAGSRKPESEHVTASRFWLLASGPGLPVSFGKRSTKAAVYRVSFFFFFFLLFLGSSFLYDAGADSLELDPTTVSS